MKLDTVLPSAASTEQSDASPKSDRKFGLYTHCDFFMWPTPPWPGYVLLLGRLQSTYGLSAARDSERCHVQISRFHKTGRHFKRKWSRYWEGQSVICIKAVLLIITELICVRIRSMISVPIAVPLVCAWGKGPLREWWSSAQTYELMPFSPNKLNTNIKGTAKIW